MSWAASVAIIIPPYADVDRPAYGPHLLQKLAADAGHKVDIIYANLHLADGIGLDRYQDIIYRSEKNYLGDSYFADLYFGDRLTVRHQKSEPLVDELERVSAAFVEKLTPKFSTYDIIGFSTVFEQNLALAYYSQLIRSAFPDKILIAGGANCEDSMAQGVAQLCPQLDFVFQGDSERSFLSFLNKGHYSEKPKQTKVIRSLGQPNVSAHIPQVRR